MTTDDDRTTAPFIMVPCVCGRTLRARREQVGAEIRCWDCQQGVVVRVPRARRRLLGLLAGAVAGTFGGAGSDTLARAALLLTACLAVPYAGLGLASLALAAGALAYEDLARGVADPGRPFGVDWRGAWRRLTPARALACAGFGAGTVGALWLAGAGPHRPPHLGPAALATLAACWAGLPLLVASGLGPRRRDGLLVLARHPLAALAIAAIVPAALVGAEAAAFGLIAWGEGLPLFVVDYVPMPGRMTVLEGFAFQGNRSYASFPPPYFVAAYREGLRGGHTLLGGVPPSLSLPTRLGVWPQTFGWSPAFYAALRLLLTAAACLALAVAAAVQARCLGVLLHARSLRLA